MYCFEFVDVLFLFCLLCGCVSYEVCLVEWYVVGEIVCFVGDECNCVEEVLNG